jgi:hypothetical protein
MNESNSIESTPKLRVLKILFDAFTLVWFRRADFMYALWLPFLLMLALAGAWDFAETSLPSSFKWVYAAAYYFLIVLFVVSCHRVVLLNSQRTDEWAMPKWSWRESRFLGWSAFIWVIGAACAVAGSIIVFTIIGNVTPQFLWPENLKSSTWTLISQYSMKLIYVYIFARLCLMLPSIAVDKSLSFQRAIKLSRGNGWRLAVVVSMTPLAIQIIAKIVYREDASAWEYMLWLTITSALLTVEIAALSLSYRELVEHAAADKP